MNTRAAAVTILNSFYGSYHNYEKKVAGLADRLKLDQKNRDYLYILVKGVIQYKNFLDHILSISTNRPLKKLEKISLNLLRLGAFQSIILKTPDHAIVYETAEATKELNRPDLVPFINAVLRHLPEEKIWCSALEKMESVKALTIEHSHPEWLVKRWMDNFGEVETKKLLAFNNSYQNIIFRHNPIKIMWRQFEKKLEEEKFSFNKLRSKPVHFFTVSNPGTLLKSRFFQHGYCSVQDFSQALSIMLLMPHSGDSIIDVCAGPGGKSTFIAQIVGRKVNLIASDISERKISMVKNECTRLGIDFVNYQVADATKERFPEVDKIIVDAPCSSTGIICKRADLRWNRRPSDLSEFTKLQSEILHNVSKFVHDRGVLLYCTCSLEFEENWGVIEKFLNQHTDYIIDPADKYVARKYCDRYGAVQILPQKHSMAGSFAVRMVRVLS